MRALRSWMFVPGHSDKMIAKSMGFDVDVVMLDLEDGVVPELKAQSQSKVAAGLSAPRQVLGPLRYVRVNGAETSLLPGDLDAVAIAGIDGIVLPKVESIAQVQEVSAMLERLERERGLANGAIRLMLAIETARAVIAAPALAAGSARVSGLMFGAEDFSRDIGLPTVRSGRAREFIHARSAIIMACHAAGVLPIDNVWPDLEDSEGLRQDTILGRDLGFTGKSLIHPSQVATINGVYQPSEHDLAFARSLIDEFDIAFREGRGSIAFGGQLVDRPIYERARATIARAARGGCSDTGEEARA